MPRTLRSPLVALLVTFTASASLPAQGSPPDYSTAMRQAHAHDSPAATPVALVPPRLQVTTESVVYATVNGKPVTGFLAKPARSARPGPAIVLVHEWWGINDNIKSVAQRYAGEGYTVLAVDLFGRVTSNPDTAMVFYQTAMKNAAAGEQNLSQAVAYLKKQGATSIGSVGYCFGGHWSLRTGLVGGPDIKAVVIYYGAPITSTTDLARLKAPVLGMYGGLDKGIPIDSVRAMERKMKDAGRTVTIHVYDDANHAFANPTGQAYNAKAADDAWQRALTFFKANLK